MIKALGNFQEQNDCYSFFSGTTEKSGFCEILCGNTLLRNPDFSAPMRDHRGIIRLEIDFVVMVGAEFELETVFIPRVTVFKSMVFPIN